ncbi:MAG: hypothetical protein LQ338_004948 [Usnochroma carphineum]|nr:MAG: hypothetical protein LQ338_004948 [Usnochroma carphineum]
MAEATVTLPGAHNYEFKTERLFFRPLRFDDVESIFALKSDPQVFYWAEPFRHKSQAEEWIGARLESNGYLSFCIEELPKTQNSEACEEKPGMIGMVGGTILPEIGYMLRPSFWGRGYATEAVRGFIKFYWDTFPEGHPSIANHDERMYLKAVTGPPEEAPQARASIAVLKKCGFDYWKDEGREDSFQPEEKIMLPVWRRWGPGYGP